MKKKLKVFEKSQPVEKISTNLKKRRNKIRKLYGYKTIQTQIQPIGYLL